MFRLLVMTTALVAFAACSSASSPVLDAMKDAQLTSADAVRAWLSSVTPAGVRQQLRFAVPGMNAFLSLDQACPAASVEGNTVTLTGDCTDESSRTWHGTHVRQYDAPGSTTGISTFEGFGFEMLMFCAGEVRSSRLRLDGTIRTSGELKREEFDVDLTVESLNPLYPIQYRPAAETPACDSGLNIYAWDFTGTIDTTNADEAVHSGTGRIGVSTVGAIYAETKDLRVSDRCHHEPLSGTTLLRAGSDTAVVTFDGNVDCDFPGAANWSLNGEVQGELTGLAW